MRKLTLIISSCFLISCVYNKKELPTPSVDTQSITDTLTYTEHVKQIIDNNCVTCHSTSGQSPALTNYTEVFSKIGRIQARAIDNNPTSMPPSNPLPQNLKDTLQIWINQGGLQ